MTPIHTILYATDFSPQAGLAFPFASALAWDYAARLVVLHVAEPVRAACRKLVVVSPARAEVTEGLRERLSRLTPENPDVSVEHHLREGDPATEILALAQEIGCNLIVMGTHGRTGVGRLLMGSVAEQVLRKATCPVLTMKVPTAVVSPILEKAAAVHA